jgi:hypothetical protein
MYNLPSSRRVCRRERKENSTMGRRALRTATAIAVAIAAGALAAPTARATAPVAAQTDFNGDGYADFVTGAPWATVGGHHSAGYVAVVYGGASGVKTARKQVISQNTAGIPGTAETYDAFGTAVATRDLDGDGYTDLVVGSPAEQVGDIAGAGSLTVVRGGPKGLSGATVIKGTAGEGLGKDIATGDFDGDGHGDIATPASIAYGPFSPAGVPARTAAIEVNPPDEGDDDAPFFTDRLAAGDVNGDGITDLVAGIEQLGVDGTNGPRYLRYALGSATGLTDPRFVTTSGGTRLEGGESLAVGDLDNDGHADLVFGRDDGEREYDAYELGGVVGIVRGSASGPDGSAVSYIGQDTAGVPGTSEPGDGFGHDLALGDVDRDGHPDLAVGVLGEDLGTIRNAGAVTLLKGTPTGLTGAGARSFTQNTAAVPGTAETGDLFGSAVALVDTTGDGRSDLVAGALGENDSAGALWALRATSSGITTTGAYSFGPGTLGTATKATGLGYVLGH